MRRTLIAALVTLTLIAQALVASTSAAEPRTPLRLGYLSTSEIARGTVVSGHRVGGLSGLDYDPRTREFVAISDDKGEYGPPRYYRIPAAGVFTGHPRPTEVTFAGLRKDSADLESIRLLRGGRLLVTSEGLQDSGAAPFVREYTRSGHALRDLPIPARYRPDYRTRGFRNNLAFEGSAVWGGTTSLLTESALAQDGPIATATAGAATRLLRLRGNGTVRDEHVYRTDPLPPGTTEGDNGNAELLALSGSDYLVIERGFDNATKRNHVKIYWTTVTGAQPVTGKVALSGTERAMPKRLVFDFAADPRIGNPDNVEGMAFGPRLPDGRRTLVLVSDDNFNASQRTLFHILAVG